MTTHLNGSPENQETQPHEEVHPSHPPNHMFVGSKKPAMGYAMFALMRLTEFDEVVIRARGAAISRAVDVAQIITKRLGKDRFKVGSIQIGTEVLGEGAETRNVSTIEIVVAKRIESGETGSG
jgi:DNA-binding protein